MASSGQIPLFFQVPCSHSRKGAGACHAAVLCLLIAVRDGHGGQSGWRVNLDPLPWMFRWCHEPDLWPGSLAAARQTLDLNFRGLNASTHTGNTCKHLWIYGTCTCTQIQLLCPSFSNRWCREKQCSIPARDTVTTESRVSFCDHTLISRDFDIDYSCNGVIR